MDYPDVASLAAPKPLLVINGRKDRLFHPGGVKRLLTGCGVATQKRGR